VKLSKTNSVGMQQPTRKVDPPPEASFASSSKRTARSVNSYGQSRVIEPRKSYIAGVFVVAIAGTTSERCTGSGARSRPGSKSTAKVNKGSQGTWENRKRPWDKTPEAEGEPVEQHPGVGAAISPCSRAKTGNQPKVGRRNATNGVTPEALR
jgi:hypothetical protein